MRGLYVFHFSYSYHFGASFLSSVVSACNRSLIVQSGQPFPYKLYCSSSITSEPSFPSSFVDKIT